MVDRNFMFPETQKALIEISKAHVEARKKDRIEQDLRRVVFKTPVRPLVVATGRCTCADNKRECDCGMPGVERTMADVLELAEARARRRVYTGAPVTQPGAL